MVKSKKKVAKKESVPKPIKKDRKDKSRQAVVADKAHEELIERRIKRGARRTTFIYGLLAILCLFLGIFNDPMYYWIILALGIFTVYWVWRGWFWRRKK